ncbi:hypothetical protein ACFHYQ_08450 [Sphaerimonospora cavernae]|uniref:Uncharacterized protein n=1 Tax=Sphaerimonospora cavernae TaxID=1740611 RepID=A0ABV6U1I6_9ACTN
MANSRLKPKPITGFGHTAVEEEQPAPAPAAPASAPEAVTEPTSPQAPPVQKPRREEPAPAKPVAEQPPAAKPAADQSPPARRAEEPPAEPAKVETSAAEPAVRRPMPAEPDEPQADHGEPSAAEEETAAGDAGRHEPEPQPAQNIPDKPRPRPVSRGTVSRAGATRTIVDLPRTPPTSSSGVTLGQAGRAVAASYLLATEGDERWAKFSVRLPDDLHRRSVRAMNRLRKTLRRRGLGTNHVWNAALVTSTPADLQVCVEWARARRQAGDGVEAPSRSTTVHPAVKEAMTDLEGDLRESYRHGLVGYLIAEIISRFLDRLEAELPDPDGPTA